MILVSYRFELLADAARELHVSLVGPADGHDLAAVRPDMREQLSKVKLRLRGQGQAAGGTTQIGRLLK
jgi:hypothetical protein